MKLVTTEVKKEEYTVYDKNLDRAVKTFDNIEDLFSEMNAYSLKEYGKRFTNLLTINKTKLAINFKETTRFYYFDVVVNEHGDNISVPRYRDDNTHSHLFGFYVTDSLGDIVDVEKMVKKPYRYKYGTEAYKREQCHREMIRGTLVVKTGNPHKIKKFYEHEEDTGGNPRYMEDYPEYNFRLYRTYRRISTYSTHKMVAAVIKEEGEPTFRGKTANIPNTWDDVRCNRWKQRKSWKHNSKRRKQWKDKESSPINNRA
jgi:hypothetical protein